MQEDQSPRATDQESDRAAGPAGPLDANQLRRITSLHRGFTYQHLYAVGCLLGLEQAGAQMLLVEREEDVEVVFPGRHLYLQVKTRNKNLTWGDIRGSVAQFDTIRTEHTAGRRAGTPQLIVVTDTDPGPGLLGDIQQADWPADVTVLWPGRPHAQESWLPPAGRNIAELLQWCTTQAERIPFGSLSAQTLVWKLAARVQYACTGAHEQAFRTGDLPQLYEQFVQELQTFPQVPDVYRPHDGEPALTSDERMRLVVGFSGAGKTTWAAHAAAHCPLPVTYFDIAGLPAAAVPGALARELAARHLSGSDALRLPAAEGIDVLRAVHAQLAQAGTTVTVVVDNVHQLDSADVQLLAGALPTAQLILLGRPWPEQIPLTAQLGITAESLPGWNTDTIAAAFAAEGCTLDYPTAQRILALTAGLPLYVLNSAHLTRTMHAGDGAAFCDAVQEQTHTTPTAQELILDKTFAYLSETARTLAALLAIAEVSLTGTELQQISAAASLRRTTVNARALRELAARGLTQAFADGHIKLHDAVQPLAAAGADDLPEEVIDRTLHALSSVLEGHRDLPRLARWMRLLAPTGRIDILLELTGQESFYEGGYPRELRTVIDSVAQDPDRDTVSRLEAHSALATWAHRDNDQDTWAHHVHTMEALAETSSAEIGSRENVLLATRQFALYGWAGDLTALKASYRSALAELPAPSRFERALRYAYAQGLYGAGHYKDAGIAALELADAYCAHLGLTPADVHGPASELHAAWLRSETPDDYKRLADCFSMFIKTCRQLQRDYGPLAFPAMKLYLITEAWSSAIDSGQDVVESLMRVDETQSALDLLDRQLIPVAETYNLPELIVGLRSQRAVVLAYAGDITAARAEISSLAQYDATPDQANDIRHQTRIIEQLAARQTPPSP